MLICAYVCLYLRDCVHKLASRTSPPPAAAAAAAVGVATDVGCTWLPMAILTPDTVYSCVNVFVNKGLVPFPLLLVLLVPFPLPLPPFAPACPRLYWHRIRLCCRGVRSCYCHRLRGFRRRLCSWRFADRKKKITITMWQFTMIYFTYVLQASVENCLQPTSNPLSNSKQEWATIIKS